MKVYLELGEDIIEKVEKITGVDYELHGDMIEVEYITNMILDLICEYHNLEEKIEKEY